MKEWRQKNADAVREYNKQWRNENPDKVAEYQQRYWEKKANEAMTID